jgi:hypothetical protein
MPVLEETEASAEIMKTLKNTRSATTLVLNQIMRIKVCFYSLVTSKYVF